jgi:glycerol uptake facilitator-like aquaporin
MFGDRTPSQFLRVKWKKFLKPQLVDKKEDVWQAMWRSFLAEFFGTMIFIFLGTGSAVAAQITIKTSEGLDAEDVKLDTGAIVLISAGFGFGLTVVIYSVGEISGGHINPAVTWATLMTGRLSVLRALVYWTAQISGAIAGSALLRALLRHDDDQFNMACNVVPESNSVARAFGAEVVYTFIFLFVVFATAISPFVGKVAPLSGGGADYGPGKLTPLAVGTSRVEAAARGDAYFLKVHFFTGLTIFALHLVSIPFTTAGFNPARSFGPAVIEVPLCSIKFFFASFQGIS